MEAPGPSTARLDAAARRGRTVASGARRSTPVDEGPATPAAKRTQSPLFQRPDNGLRQNGRIRSRARRRHRLPLQPRVHVPREVLAADGVEPAVEGGMVGPVMELPGLALAAGDVEAPVAQPVEAVQAGLGARHRLRQWPTAPRCTILDRSAGCRRAGCDDADSGNAERTQSAAFRFRRNGLRAHQRPLDRSQRA